MLGEGHRAIRKRLRDHEQILLGGAGTVRRGGAGQPRTMAAVRRTTGLAERYPGIQGVGFTGHPSS